MIGLLQRVTTASVVVSQQIIAQIESGLLVLIGVERDDTEQQADRLLQRLLAYRVFSDSEGKMNLSLTDTGGGLLLVPQFTLPADTRKGKMRIISYQCVHRALLKKFRSQYHHRGLCAA